MVTMNILMDGDKSVCAYFKKKKYTLTIIASNGTVTGAGVYDAKAVVNIQATPNVGYQFDHWSGGLSGSVNPTTILMNSNKTVTANFTLIPVVQYALTTSVDPINSGIVTGAGIYDKGTEVIVEATPAVDYDFDHWNGAIGKWSGLGMCLFSTSVTSEFDGYVDTLLANGFTELRIDIPGYNDPVYIAQGKAAIIRAIAKGAKVIWGVCSGGATITSTTWVDQRAGILSAAQWAQDNGVYEFLIGNEEEMELDETMTVAQLIVNLKDVATDVQEIFTNGNVSYSFWAAERDAWFAAGKGDDIDLLASNIMMGGNGGYSDYWKTIITNMVNAFGVDGTYLTEFAPSWSALTDYSTDEAVQAAAVTEMIDHIKASGIKRANFFCYANTPNLLDFGIVKDDGTYRLLWNSLINYN